MKKVYVLVLTAVLTLALASVAFAADQKTTAPKAKPAMTAPKMPPVPQPMGPRGAMRSNFNMMLGTVSKIDMSDPANVKLEVKDERDNQLHVVEVTPAANVTKSTEISELKVGDTVRVMARKVDNKEVAMGVMFGKFKKMPAPKMPGQPGVQTPPAAVKEEAKK